MELDFIVQDTLISDSLGYGYDYLYSILLQENFSVWNREVNWKEESTGIFYIKLNKINTLDKIK